MCVQLYGMDAIMYVWCVDEYAVYINVHVCDIANHYRETTCVVWCVDGYTVYINAHVCDIANSYRKLLAGHYAPFGGTCVWNQMAVSLVHSLQPCGRLRLWNILLPFRCSPLFYPGWKTHACPLPHLTPSPDCHRPRNPGGHHMLQAVAAVCPNPGH